MNSSLVWPGLVSAKSAKAFTYMPTAAGARALLGKRTHSLDKFACRPFCSNLYPVAECIVSTDRTLESIKLTILKDGIERHGTL